MKDKVIRIVKIIFVVLAGIAICWGIFYLLDYGLNGMVVDWFSKYMMEEVYEYSAYRNDYITTIRPDWYRVKRLALDILLFSVVFWIMIIFVAAHLQARREKQNVITAISRMIHQYMEGDAETIDVFPKEYAEILTQMLEIKANIQRNEQILKEEANRKNDLIAYLAHDLKTPLTSVIGYLSLLNEIPEMPMEQRVKYVNITLDKANRLEKLINEFFDITRYNLQQITLDREPTDISYMLAQMTDEFYPILNEHGNTITLDAENDLTVAIDAEKMARVFNNILKNAVAYSYHGTVIKVVARKMDGYVDIIFQNMGKTIPEQKLESIFEKFFRLDEARTSNTGGAGLGLAIAKEIVTLHGGTIAAVSENDMTIFSVTLPL